MEEFFVFGGLDCAVDEARGLMEGCHRGCSLRVSAGVACNLVNIDCCM